MEAWGGIWPSGHVSWILHGHTWYGTSLSVNGHRILLPQNPKWIIWWFEFSFWVSAWFIMKRVFSCHWHLPFQTPIKVDLITLNMTRGRFVRVCMEINLETPVVRNFCLNGSWYHVEYEGLHMSCASCGCYGHVARN